MKFKHILVATITTILLSQVLYANTEETVKTVKTEVAEEIKAPIVGGSVIGISVATLSTTGYRASKLLKSNVYNQEGDKIGTIDDFIVGGENEVSFAILSVGGVLGIGDRLVAVPAKLFTSNKEQQVILAKVSKEDLEALPAFQYAK
jgi:sporulation protein YlmC with PRC-barrel domain